MRARISEDNGQNYSSEKYTMSELKAKLEALTQDENNIGKTFTIAYVYAATDSQDVNI